MPLSLALTLTLLMAISSVPAPVAHSLRTELLAMEAEDQALRLAKPVDVKAIVAADAKHTARMKTIVTVHGWPTSSLVGSDGASAAWLLVQHADADPDFQRMALELMEPLLASGEIKSQEYAYLWDRTHQPQRYGTQGSCSGQTWTPDAIEQPESVDARRRGMGMGPLTEYVQIASTMCSGR